MYCVFKIFFFFFNPYEMARIPVREVRIRILGSESVSVKRSYGLGTLISRPRIVSDFRITKFLPHPRFPLEVRSGIQIRKECLQSIKIVRRQKFRKKWQAEVGEYRQYVLREICEREKEKYQMRKTGRKREKLELI
jgi:hypothetical protein